MKNTIKLNFAHPAILLFVSILISGCTFNAPEGPSFTKYTPRDSKNAIIYFYRTKGERFGYDRRYFISVNEEKVGDALHGGYFAHEIAPGEVAVLSDLSRTVTASLPLVTILLEAAANPDSAKLSFTASSGEIYFVRMRPETELTHFVPRLSLVSKEIGEREIASLKRVN